MNFLADESVDRGIVERLRQEGHEVSYVAEMEPGLPDDARAMVLRVSGGVLGDGLALPLEQVEIGPPSEGALRELSRR